MRRQPVLSLLGLLMIINSIACDHRQYFVSIHCPTCAAKGKILWEGSGRQKALVYLSEQFYERLRRAPPHPIELVCRACGTSQLE